MSRLQVSIDRLTPRRATVEPREAMNCKSCRKRKIKCNRLRPSCEACKVFQTPCLYDAVPKKRGPKSEVLEALLKRVDGLEKRLQDENNPGSPQDATLDLPSNYRPSRRNTIHTSSFHLYKDSLPVSTPISQSEPFHSPDFPVTYNNIQPLPKNGALSIGLLDAYFARIHGKPFFIVDETTIRQQYQSSQLPEHLSLAISALTTRYTYVIGQPEQLLRQGLDTALQARQIVDVDDPSIDGLQTLLLLSQTFFAYGLGKKAYMTLSNCVAMVVALDLFREVPSKANMSPPEREMRRRLFWSVYILDRFITCGSRRPSLISDHSLVLRLPSWSPHAAGLNMEGELFHVGPNIQYSADSRTKHPSVASLLIDITRILGVTNRYLAAGGVKGDSHFPWHALSTLSKIRQELDIWAAGTQDMFASIEALFGHPESTTLLLSKLIYHLVHCLLYRPFLPIDLVELRGTGQHQSWQIEATNLCFSHSNAIAELVELGRNYPLVEWPAFISYCVCTAGTVHVHGVHYKGREGEVFSSSAEFLTREMHQLVWLRNAWAGVQHQREMLQTIYTCHTELVRNLAASPMRFSSVFHLEDFLDRYPGLTADGAHVRLIDTRIDHAGAAHLLDRQDLYYRPMAPPYQTPTFSTTSTAIRSTRPQKSHFMPKPHSNEPLSPIFNFQSASPLSLSSIFPVPVPVPVPVTVPGLGSDSVEVPTSQTENNLSHLNVFSPTSFALSPPVFLTDPQLNIAPTSPPILQYATFPFDTPNNFNYSGSTAQTPGAQSQTSGSHTAGSETGNWESDPFLTLLEQLAENEHSLGGPSELDFFLGESDPLPEKEKEAASEI